MPHTSRLVTALAVATVAAGAASVVLKSANGNPTGDILLTTVGGAAFLGAGVVTSRCRPGNRTDLYLPDVAVTAQG